MDLFNKIWSHKVKKKSTQNPLPLSACGVLGTELNY